MTDWEGVPARPSEHRTTGARAWCHGDMTWCYPDVHCPCCLAASKHHVICETCDGVGYVARTCCVCGERPARTLPDPIPEGTEVMSSEAVAGRGLYCTACFEEAE